MKNICAALFATLIATLISTTAFAQDTAPPPDTMPTSETTATTTTTNTSKADSMTMSDDAGAFTGLQAGTKAISAFFYGGDGTQANLLWGLSNRSMFDLALGVSYRQETPAGGTESTTIFGLDLGIGYRMYMDRSGRINPYISPFVGFIVGNFEEFSETFGLDVGAALGVDYMMHPQFSLGAQFSGALGFREEFDTITFGLSTAGVNATFWWQ